MELTPTVLVLQIWLFASGHCEDEPVAKSSARCTHCYEPCPELCHHQTQGCGATCQLSWLHCKDAESENVYLSQRHDNNIKHSHGEIKKNH